MRGIGLVLATMLLLLVGAGGVVGAHALALFAHVSVDPAGELVVRIVDPYGALVEGQEVLASGLAPGGRPTKPVTLTEGPPGTYRGKVVVPGADRYEATVDLVLVGDLHRIQYEIRAGEGQPERMMAMVGIDPPEGLSWSRILFIAAAAVLIAGTGLSLVKRRPALEGE